MTSKSAQNKVVDEKGMKGLSPRQAPPKIPDSSPKPPGANPGADKKPAKGS